MGSIPSWLSAVGVLIVIASALGSAVAVYRTTLQGTSLREAERTIERLRGEIGDYRRRETEFEAAIQVQAVSHEALVNRLKVLEDLLTKRKDDDQIRTEMASMRATLEAEIPKMAEIRKIVDEILRGGAKAP